MTKNTDPHKSIYILQLVMAAFIGLLIVFIIVYKTKEKEKHEINFDLLYNCQIHDRIISKDIDHNILSLRFKYTKTGFSCRNPRNYFLEPNNLFDFVKITDSINKPDFSYDFYIIRPDGKYHFVLDQDINKQWK
jgi:hypothetical protein